MSRLARDWRNLCGVPSLEQGTGYADTGYFLRGFRCARVTCYKRGGRGWSRKARRWR